MTNTDANTNPDVIIIGGGAAGLSAALVLSRARWATLVIDAGEPRNAPATEMHGFLSRDGMPPADLLATGRTEVLGYGGAIQAARVSSVERGADDRFAVTLEGGNIVSARALLVASGLTSFALDYRSIARSFTGLTRIFRKKDAAETDTGIAAVECPEWWFPVGFVVLALGAPANGGCSLLRYIALQAAVGTPYSSYVDIKGTYCIILADANGILPSQVSWTMRVSHP